ARPRRAADTARPRRRGGRVKRREFITLLGGAAAAWPLGARAQQSERMRRIAVLMNLAEDDREGLARLAVFKQALQELGWVDGRNARFDIRWGAGNDERYRMLATELVSLSPDVILGAAGSADRKSTRLNSSHQI